MLVLMYLTRHTSIVRWLPEYFIGNGEDYYMDVYQPAYHKILH